MANSASSADQLSFQPALERAIKCEDRTLDEATTRTLEAAITDLWRRIENQPDNYIMTRDEFALFNYFFVRFQGSHVARRAVARFWDSYDKRLTFSNTDSSTSLPHEHATPVSMRTTPIDQESSTFSISLDALEDIEQELMLLVSLKRTGQYRKAHRIFHDILSTHLSVFPVVAEYADLLLHQGHYRVLSDFLDIQLQCMKDVFTEEEMRLLVIMKSLASVYTHGALRSALLQASHTWEFLANIAVGMDPGSMPNDVQIHIFEIYMSIISIGVASSNWVSMEDMQCPWVTGSSSGCTGFTEWYRKLSRRDDHLWEASRVLCILCPLLHKLPCPDIYVLFDAPCFGIPPTRSSIIHLSEADRIIAYTVSSSRVRALLKIALLRLPITKDDLSQRLWERACLYHSAANSIVSLIHAEAGDELLQPQINIFNMEFHLAGKSLGQYVPADRFPYIDFDQFMQLTCREARHSYISMLIQRGFDSHDDARHASYLEISFLFPSILGIIESGDLLGSVQACKLCFDSKQRLTTTERYEEMMDSVYLNVDYLQFLRIALDSNDALLEAQSQLLERLRRMLPFDDVKAIADPELTFHKQSDSYPELFDMPAYLVCIHEVGLLSGLPQACGKGKNADAFKVHLPYPDIRNRIENIGLALVALNYIPGHDGLLLPEPSGVQTQYITTESSYHSLDPLYQSQSHGFFKPGRIFSVPWHERSGRAKDHHTFASQVLYPTRYGDNVYSRIHRLVVVKEYPQCAWCFPIYGYHGRGLSESSANAWKNAIIFTEGTQPASAPGEPRMSKAPIEVRLDSLDQRLDPMSRLNFGELFTIEDNVKVLPVGKITERSMPAFMNYARQHLLIV